MSDSHSDEDGVIGYQATTVTPAIMQPMRGGGVALDEDLARRLVHPLDAQTDPLREKLACA